MTAAGLHPPRRVRQGSSHAEAALAGGVLGPAVSAAAAVAQLLRLHKGDAAAVAGTASLRTWTGRDGKEHTGLGGVRTRRAERLRCSARAARRQGQGPALPCRCSQTAGLAATLTARAALLDFTNWHGDTLH